MGLAARETAQKCTQETFSRRKLFLVFYPNIVDKNISGIVRSRVYIGPETNKGAQVGAGQMHQAHGVLCGTWRMLLCAL